MPQDTSLTASRRSAADLQEQLQAIFNDVCATDKATVLVRELPSVIQRFEEKRNLKILDGQEMDLLTDMSMNEVFAANEVTVEELTALLTELMRAAHPENDAQPSPPSPRSLRSSVSERSLGDKELSGLGNLASPSSMAPGPPTPVTAIKMAPILPRSASDQTIFRPASPGTPSRIPVPRSTTTGSLSEMTRATSPLAHIKRTSPLSAVSSPEIGRPRSNRAQKARRESQERGARSREGTPEPTSPLSYRNGHGRTSSDFADRFARRKSSLETLAWSPPVVEGLDSMTSPGLVESSFHTYPISPPADLEAPRPSFEESQNSLGSLDMSRKGSQILRETMGDNSGSGFDFFRESISSVSGMQPNQMAQLLRDAGEMVKKVKESEERYAKLQEEYEAQVLELQGRLDEASAEMLSKRKEEKEARVKREQYLSTIRDHEKDIARLEGVVQKEQELVAEVKQRLDSQAGENCKLLEDLQLKEQTLQDVEEELRHEQAEHEQLQREYAVAETRVQQLQTDLEESSKAQEELEGQREVNAGLNEELQRLRTEVEAAQARPTPSRADSDFGSVTRSLSREIRRRLAAREESESASSSGETEEVAPSHARSLSHESSSISIRGDLMANVQRRQRKHSKPRDQPSTSIDVSTQTQTPATVPPEPVHDAPSVDDAASASERPPPYSPPTGAMAHFLKRIPLGLRALHDFSPFVYSVVETTAGFVFYSVSVWLIGVVTGIMISPNRVSHDPYWMLQSAHHVEVAGASIFGPRLAYWLNEIIWNGLDRSRRVPI